MKQNIILNLEIEKLIIKIKGLWNGESTQRN